MTLDDQATLEGTAAIEATLAWAFPDDDDVFEIRLLNTSKRTQSGYFKRGRSAVRAIEYADRCKPPAVYFTINPCISALMARASNRIESYAKTVTSDREVQRRRNLLVDGDAKRPPGVSSTDAQHEAAVARIRDVYEFLRKHGVKDMLVGDSGNGGHLLVAIDLSNDDESRHLCERVLKALDYLFSDELVKVDVAVANAARISKVYGTMARKGDSTPQHPHRRSRILHLPEHRENTTRDVLEAIAAMLPAGSQSEAQRTKNTTMAFDLDDFLREHHIAVKGEKVRDGVQYRFLVHCPFGPHQGPTKTAVMQYPSAALGFKCQSASCTQRDWFNFRSAVDPNFTPFSHNARHKNGAPAECPGVLETRCAANIHAAAPDFFSAGRIPFGALTLADGDGGVGKSTTFLGIVAQSTVGIDLLTGTTIEPMTWLIVATEDSEGLIKLKLGIAGAELSRIHFIGYAKYDATPEPFMLPDHAALLRAKALELGATGLYIDAFFSHIDPEGEGKMATKVRHALTPVDAVVKELNLVWIGVRHPTKGRGRAREQAGGSIEFANFARSTIRFGDNPKKEHGFVLVSDKHNWAGATPALEYELAIVETVDDNGRPCSIPKTVIGQSDGTITADDIAMSQILDPDERSAVEELLCELLAGGEWRPREQIWAAAGNAKIARSTLYRAARKLGVKHRLEGFPAKAQWRLTAQIQRAIGDPDASGANEQDSGGPGSLCADCGHYPSVDDAALCEFCLAKRNL
jgi:hypothetical protein